jgi:hypothetical protein
MVTIRPSKRLYSGNGLKRRSERVFRFESSNAHQSTPPQPARQFPNVPCPAQNALYLNENKDLKIPLGN